jgi:hypothetical protein
MSTRSNGIARQAFGGQGAGGAGWRWAKVTALQDTYVRARLVDNSGEVTGDEFDVHLYAATVAGPTITPTVANLSPNPAVGSWLRVTTYRGPTSNAIQWWSVDTFWDTCVL